MQSFIVPVLAIATTVWFGSCQTLKESSKYKFSNGFYTTRNSKQKETVYLLANGSDTIKEYKKDILNLPNTDSVKNIYLAFPLAKPDSFTDRSFRQSTFDLDVLTVLFKYRPATQGFPPQFNATFNGAIFIGYRSDIYNLSYKSTPLHDFRRTITHYGYSMGVFTGLGTARIDEYVTKNALNYEYDGLVNVSGIAVILAIDKLTAGITLGADHLLDKNKQVWIYNGKPWLGLSIGLNLN